MPEKTFSVNVVHALGPHAGPFMALGCSATALLALVEFELERAVRKNRSVPAAAA